MPSKKILVIDDDTEDQLMMREAFLANNFIPDKLVFAQDGEMAIRLLHDSPSIDFPGLIILDLNMPRMNGFSTLRYLKDHPLLKDIPVIIWTTSSNVDETHLCNELGAMAYEVKPILFDLWKTKAHWFYQISEGNLYAKNSIKE